MILMLGLAGLSAACGASAITSPTSTEPLVPSSTPIPVASSTPEATSAPEAILQGTGPERVEEGRSAYVQACAVCHGPQAEGYANDQGAPALDSSEHASHHPDSQIHEWIVNGKLGLGQQMPAFGERFSDGEVHAIIAYLHSLWTEDQLQVQQSLSRRSPATPEPTWTPGP